MLNNQIIEYKSKIDVLSNDITRSFINIKEKFISLRSEILLEIDTANDKSELGTIVQTRFGKDGYILEQTVNLIVLNFTGNVLSESKKVLESLCESLKFNSKMQDSIGKNLSKAGKSVMKTMFSGSTRTIADSILKTRNFLKIPFKFKPWGAMKLAKGLKIAPIIFDTGEFAFNLWANHKMNKIRAELKRDTQVYFKELIESTTLESFTKDHFPYVELTNKELQLLEISSNEIQEGIDNIDSICIQLTDNNLF